MHKINPFQIEPSQEQRHRLWREDDNIEFEEDEFSHASSAGSGNGNGNYGHSESIHLLDEEGYEHGVVFEEEDDEDDIGICANPIRLVCMTMIVSVCFAILFLLSTDKDTSDDVAGTTTPSLYGNEEEEKLEKSYKIVVLGERNSGVPWMLQQLNRCYPNTEVTNVLQRSGEWFQDETLYQPPPNDDKKQTLVITLFFNPYDWINSMRINPIHMPSHTNMTDWKTFVKAPWTVWNGRPDSDEILLQNQQNTTNAHFCQFNFSYNQVVPCTPSTSYNSTYPVYELKYNYNDTTTSAATTNQTTTNTEGVKGNGNPYSSIAELRRDKILNFLNVQNWNTQENLDVIVVKYEDMMKSNAYGNGTDKPGLAHIFSQIEEKTGGIKSKCNLDMSENPSSSTSPLTENEIDSFIALEPIDNFEPGKVQGPKYMSWVNKHVDWDVEGLVGYKVQKADKS